jgi:hypothetical protein
MLCPCNVRHKFFIHFWNRTIHLCMPCICWLRGFILFSSLVDELKLRYCVMWRHVLHQSTCDVRNHHYVSTGHCENLKYRSIFGTISTENKDWTTTTQVKCTPSPCFTSVSYTLSCFNAPCQFTPLLSLRSLIFGLTPVGWLRSITLSPYFWWEYHFWFTCTFSEKQLGRKRGAGCILKKKATRAGSAG